MKSKEFLIVVILSIAVFLISAPVFPGDLNPPGPPSSTFKSLDQIPPTWDQILPAAQRFKLVIGGEAVLDKETGLVWEKSPSSRTFDWVNDDIFFHCNTLRKGNRLGWRVPTVQELATLVDASTGGLPEGHPFSNVQSAAYWSANTYALDTKYAWIVFFRSSEVNAQLKTEANTFLWCVRGAGGVNPQ
jgi:hypothetical protein